MVHAAHLIGLALGLALAAPVARGAQEGHWPGELPAGPVLPLGDPVGSQWAAAFFPGVEHDPALVHPDRLLEQPVGSRAARHGEVLTALRLWDAASERLTVSNYGTTHEGRELVLAVVAGPRWQSRLDEVRGALRRAAGFEVDGEGDGSDATLAEDLPAIAWLGYGIHGDETSATDAALALVWHFAAARGPEIDALLDEVVLVIDPCLNPDGRERILNQFEELRGHVASFDHAAMQRGRWPFGRGNHYLFDLNRDWLFGVGPETRARWRAVLDWMPQLFVDGHEMTPLDTFLFYPQAEAHHPLLPPKLGAWQNALAKGAAGAFDSFGWSYYTREWADGWAPFYSDAWGSLNGAVGMLYEMARGGGQPVLRASGELVPYRQSVHRQVVATLANLETLRANRRDVQADWLSARRAPLEEPEFARSFYVDAANEPERLALLVDLLVAQDIAVEMLDEAHTLDDAEGVFARAPHRREFGPGALRVRARQPQGRLVRALLDLDPRMPDSYLQVERRELERFGSSKIYDGTSWSLAYGLGLDGVWAAGDGPEGQRVQSSEDLAARRAALGLDVAPRAGAVLPAPDPTAVAYAVDGRLDAAPRFALAAMERGLIVHHGELAFRGGERTFTAGSLLLRRHENGAEFDRRVAEAAAAARVEVHALGTSRSPDDGPDLGGGHFRQLERPRIALLSNAPTSPDGFGHVWHHLDRRLGAVVSLVDAQAFGEQDLRRYNVLVVPPLWGDLAALLAPVRDDLAAWIEGGGTLIGIGSGAEALLGDGLDLSAVVQRGDDAEALAALRAAARRELAAGRADYDVAGLWEGTRAPEEGGFAGEGDEAPPGAESREAWLTRFAPAGVHLLAELAPRHWLTAGLSETLPVPFAGSAALLARLPVASPARFGEAPTMRLGGLLWPEARERIELSSYTTVERRGSGQVILFASDPVFRGQHLAAGRLLSHAVVYGPGLGASAPVPR